MARFLSSLACSSLVMLALAMPAGATPIVGGTVGLSQSFKANVGGLFNSSLKSDGASNGDHQIPGATGLIQTSGFAPHQFILRVPPPVVTETPEPSTLALFGTGLLMLGGLVRKRFAD